MPSSSRLALFAGLLLLGGCPAPRGAAVLPAQQAPEQAAEPRPSDDAVDDGWRYGDAPSLDDPLTGLRFELPPGWGVRLEPGGAALNARAPENRDLGLQILPWSGSVADVLGALERKPGGFVSAGPYEGIEAFADATPLVSSWDAGPKDPSLHLAWYFSVGGEGRCIVASVPRAGYERHWRVIEGILRSAESHGSEP